MYPVAISSTRLALREFTPADVDALLAIYGDPRVAEHMSFEPRSREQLEKTIEGVAGVVKAEPRMDYSLAVVLPDDELVAFARLAIDVGHPLQNSAQLGFALRADRWRQGLGTEVVRLLLQLGFEQPCHRVAGFGRPLHPCSRMDGCGWLTAPRPARHLGCWGRCCSGCSAPAPATRSCTRPSSRPRRPTRPLTGTPKASPFRSTGGHKGEIGLNMAGPVDARVWTAETCSLGLLHPVEELALTLVPRLSDLRDTALDRAGSPSPTPSDGTSTTHRAGARSPLALIAGRDLR